MKKNEKTKYLICKYWVSKNVLLAEKSLTNTTGRKALMCKIKNENYFVEGTVISGGRSLLRNLNAGSKCGPHSPLFLAIIYFG
jgi:hypothetical protein